MGTSQLLMMDGRLYVLDGLSRSTVCDDGHGVLGCVAWIIRYFTTMALV